MSNINTAAELLKNKNYTLAAVSDSSQITSRQRGVKPLIELIDNKTDLNGYSVADKVIGKAAALLYVLLKPDEIFAFTISRPAVDVLSQNHIKVKYDTLTEAIRNRDNTGFCPMESAVINTQDPYEAINLIKKRLSELSK